mmetsp:Transcript_42713/g.112422  ORF Transcript_42713/g.112422 Transcript_42713/m.112422 type:complete len:315 (+) Transcript_42713:539-1483(+)
MRLVAKGHNILVLIVLPLEEALHDTLDVKAWVIGQLEQPLDVLGLETDSGLVGRRLGGVCVLPLLPLCFHCCAVGQLDTTEDDVTSVPRLHVEHVEGEPLILHANVHQLVVVGPHHTFVEAVDPEYVIRLQLQLGLDEWEVVPVTCAHDDGVDVLCRAILKMARASLDLLQQRHCCEVVGPMKSHGSSAPRACDRLDAVLVALRCDVLRRVARADDKDVLGSKLLCGPEVVGMHNTAGECVRALELRNVGGRKVATAHDQVVKHFRALCASGRMLGGDGEHLRRLIEGCGLDSGVANYPLFDPALFDPPSDVVV